VMDLSLAVASRVHPFCNTMGNTNRGIIYIKCSTKCSFRWGMSYSFVECFDSRIFAELSAIPWQRKAGENYRLSRHTSSKRAFGRTFDIDDASVCVAHRQRTLSPSVSIIGNCILTGHPYHSLWGPGGSMS
jgi:hypothetical protein